ncbi:MAG: transcriptional repressor LexA, partial [Deltaproteobacteria bacterium]|nr:transcriptional repressor LexA [Deltaproteobacteria bacterium]
TERQRRVLEFIEAHLRDHGFPPTIREIGRHLSIKSTNGVSDHLNALQKKGFLTREGGKSRTLQLVRDHDGHAGLHAEVPLVGVNDDLDVKLPGLADHGDDDDDLVDVPLLGRVAAGAPILAEQDREDTVRVSSFFLGGQKHQKVFALKVVGESMIEDGIFDSDYLFVRKQPVAHAGDIVVAMIEGEATVKRYFPEGDRIRFQPGNSRMEPIFVEKRSFRQTDILGIVVGVYRKV